MTKRTRPATTADAKAVTLLAWRRYGRTPFKTSPASPNFPALMAAQKLGYIWFPNPSHAVVTDDGKRVLADFGVGQDE